jgi:hypothetical protein
MNLGAVGDLDYRNFGPSGSIGSQKYAEPIIPQLGHLSCVASKSNRERQRIMKLAKIAATALALAVALPTVANAASHHRYYYGHGDGNSAAAAHFQDQFKNTY